MERKLKLNFSKLSLKFEKNVDKTVRKITIVDKNVRKFTKIDMKVKLETLFSRHGWDLREKYVTEISETSQKLQDKVAEVDRKSIVNDLKTKLRIIFTNHFFELREDLSKLTLIMEEEIGETIRTCQLIVSKTKIHEVLEFYISRIYNKHRKYIFEVSDSMEEIFKAARIMKPCYQKSVQVFDTEEHMKLIKKIHQNMKKISLEIEYNSDKAFSSLLDYDKELISSRESQVRNSESVNFTDANINKQFPNSPQNKVFASLLESKMKKKLVSSIESQRKNSESRKFPVTNSNEEFPRNSPQNKEFSALLNSDKKLIFSRESRVKDSESENVTEANTNEQFPGNSPQNNVVKAKTKEFSTTLLDSDKLISSKESQGKNSESGKFTVANTNEKFPSTSPQDNSVKAKTNSIKKLPTQSPEKSDSDSKGCSQKNLSCRRKDKIITKEKESIKLNDFEDFICNDKDSDSKSSGSDCHSDLEPYAEMEEINYDHFRHGHKGEDNTVANKKNIGTTSKDFAAKGKQENAGTNEREEELSDAFVFVENHFGESSLLPSYSGFSSNTDDSFDMVEDCDVPELHYGSS